ncbi:MAG: tRNA guanosine(34) transglycosylase Tgt [Candidatus Thermoplasmatota archaeon]|nr:tRNA guanosine(34) transglycosylase Tgt [Candidatus Thermoplasmatota archaeon]
MFEVMERQGRARIGRLHTSHGILETPVFLPVATKAVIKTLTPEEAWEAGCRGVIVNALHLYRRGMDRIRRAGGIHAFMGWPGVVVSDSGGFQSIKQFPSQVSSEGVTFAMPDGSRETFTPEKSLAVQGALGVDYAYVLDDCPPYPASKERVTQGVDTTIAWARRSQGEGRFAILQGGVCAQQRVRCARALAPLHFDGFAIGGLCIGEPKEDMHRMVEVTISHLPEDKPRHLMGVGSAPDIRRAVAAGVDIFDSAFPTRNARHGTVFTSDGRINLGRARVEGQEIQPDCRCYTCRHFTLDYLNHLFREKDPLGPRLATIHNLFYINQVMEAIKEEIKERRFG